MAHHTEPFLEQLAQGPLLADGAMGTLLYARLGSESAHATALCFDALNQTHPDLVQAVHQEYIAAGARIIETNTFGANRNKLARYGLADQVRELNRKGVRLAREAREVAGQPVYVAGAIGPSGLSAVEIGQEEHENLRSLFHEQIDALVEAGVDLIILETMSHLGELVTAVQTARAVCDLPIIAQMTFAEDGNTLAGQTPAEVVQALSAAKADVIGVNCGMGPHGTLDIIQSMATALQHLPAEMRHPFLSTQPNAGMPSRVEGRFLYVSTPDYFADYARRFMEAGVNLIGGCCGTTPRHIAAMHAAILPGTSAQTFSIPAIINESSRNRPDEDQFAVDPGTPTRLQQQLAAGTFVISAELDPPKGLNPTKVLAGAEVLRKRGVMFVNIADSPTARVRMSCLSLARLLHDYLDIEPILHVTTRDRNLMALQSDLLGAHALGLRNILALTGDPLRSGEYPNLTGVWNTDSIGLMRILRGMNEGHDAGNSPLGGQASFFIGAALDAGVADTPIDFTIEEARHKLHSSALACCTTEQELESARFAAKLEAGAQYIMTQFLYDLEPLRQFYARFGKPSVPVILGMGPLYSFKHAEFLHNEVRGISIPPEIRERMRRAGERGREVGLEIAYELISAARAEGLIQGCYLLPSYGRYDLMAELAAALQHDQQQGE